MRVIVDTNWYISLLIKKHDSRLHFILLAHSIDIIISNQLIDELTGKIKEDKFRKYFTIEHALKLIDFLKIRAVLEECVSEISVCRDSKDNYLLALSKDSRADFLITGDGDLLTLGKFEKTIICTLPYFIDKYLKT